MHSEVFWTRPAYGSVERFGKNSGIYGEIAANERENATVVTCPEAHSVSPGPFASSLSSRLPVFLCICVGQGGIVRQAARIRVDVVGRDGFVDGRRSRIASIADLVGPAC